MGLALIAVPASAYAEEPVKRTLPGGSPGVMTDGAKSPSVIRLRYIGEPVGDWPHISSSSGPTAVSAHGWWRKAKNGDYRVGDTATIYNILYAKGFTGWWKLAESPRRSLPQGGGSGNWTVARYECRDKNSMYFYSQRVWGRADAVGANWKSVDVYGTKPLPCRPKGW